MTPLQTSATAAASCGTLRAVGPWFRDEAGHKALLRGVTYGPFKPNQQGLPWPEEPQFRADLAQIRELGFGSVRIYESPTDAFLQACEDNHLRLVCGIPWTQHVDFIADKAVGDDARRRIVQEAARLGAHSCVAALLVGNEIEKTLVRWMGPQRVLTFIEELIAEAKQAAPGKLVSYAAYPSTEYLIPRNADFIAFNVFLERRDTFARYVQHLQNLAAGKPLVITEFGFDAKAHGEDAQSETFRWQHEVCAAAGVAGNFWFSFTDEWHRGGEEVTGWEFGLVTRNRSLKAEGRRLKEENGKHDTANEAAVHPSSLIPHPSAISVLVCTRNGSATLRDCLEALGRQTHPDFEVLVIDDGSTDATPDIAKSFGFVRCHRQEHAGLSAARNLGMNLARGELLAYTDDDCIPDEDWLTHVSRAFDDARCVAAGGPNLPPPARSVVEACVGVAPGAPSHVLLDDFEAEHLPGCNLVIRKSALRAIGGFREEFTTAGDDVDVCWRLQAHGGKLRFVPAAMVWHHRRCTVPGYLRQQRGYGHAEAMLIRRYPHRFAWLGGARWRGMIYGDTPPHLLNTGTVIRFGRFGNALFQTVYATNEASVFDWMTGLPWFIASLLAFAFSSTWSNAWLLGVSMLLLMSAAAWRRTRVLPGARAEVTGWQVPVLWLLCLLQPVVRDWGRLSGMLRLNAWPRGRVVWPWRRQPGTLLSPRKHWWRETFWSENGVGREALLQAMRHLAPRHGLQWSDADERSECDATLSIAHGWNRVTLATVTEFHEAGRTLTRVAWGPHPPGAGILGVCWAFVGVISAPRFGWSLPSWIAYLWLPVVVVWLRNLWKTEHTVRELIDASAKRCGLCKDGTPRETTPEELHQRALASTAQPAEVCLNKP